MLDDCAQRVASGSSLLSGMSPYILFSWQCLQGYVYACLVPYMPNVLVAVIMGCAISPSFPAQLNMAVAECNLVCDCLHRHGSYWAATIGQNTQAVVKAVY